MKKKIHPTYYPKAKVKCACGATFEVGSTKKEIEVLRNEVNRKDEDFLDS